MCLYLNLLLEVCWPFSRTSSKTKTITKQDSEEEKKNNNYNTKNSNGQLKQLDRSQQINWSDENRDLQREGSQQEAYYGPLKLKQNNLKPLDDLTGEEEKKKHDKDTKEGKEKMSTITGQEPQQQHQQSVNDNISQTNSAHQPPSGQTSNGVLVEAAKFKVRTQNRRHLDFDGQYDLGDVKAKNRSTWSGAFYFIQAADSQLGMIDSYVHKRTEPGWKEEIELCEQLVSICNRMEPRPLFMIICGDLVDSRPASEVGTKQVADFKRIFAKLDQRIPLVCVCGNHDIGNEPTVQTVNEYRQTFGDDYYYFTRFDILFIVINSQFYQHREFVEEKAREQDEWLEEMLSKCKLFKYSFVFEHIPWFLNNPDEEDDYFNIRKEIRLTWLRKFKEAGVTKIMCGHYHRNAGGWFEDMELVVTSAIGAQCGSDRSGVRIVRVLENSIEHKYYAMPDIPLKIEL